MSRNLHRLSLIVLIAAATQCEQAPSGTSVPDEEGVLATVAGEPITEADLLEEVEWRRSRREAVPAAADLLDEVIRRRALLAKARSEGLEDEPATRRRMESLLIARLRERDLAQVVAAASIEENELREAYEARSEELARKGQDRFAILFLEVSERSSDARRQETRTRLEEGIAKSDASPAPGGRGPAAMGFGAVATEYSDDQIGRYRGGDIGWVEEGAGSPRVPDEVLDAGRPLTKGQRSDIIPTEVGFYVIMKTDSRPGGMPALEELSPQLHRDLLVEKRRAIEERFMAEVLDAADVSINSAAVDQIELPESRTPTPSPGPPVGPDASLSPSASR